MTALLFTFISGLLIGIVAGAWAAPRVKIRKRQPDPFDVPFGWEREP